MMGIEDILQNDEREINLIYINDNDVWRVGFEGTTRIEAYGEPGEYGDKPWFKVWVGDEIVTRVNASAVGYVDYKK